MPQSEIEMEELDEAQLEELYTWIDEIQLSRPKRNMNRDFSDGGIKKFQYIQAWEHDI